MSKCAICCAIRQNVYIGVISVLGLLCWTNFLFWVISGHGIISMRMDYPNSGESIVRGVLFVLFHLLWMAWATGEWVERARKCQVNY